MLYIPILWLVWMHPFYVSVTNIEQSRDKNSLEISSRIFFDDLEAALKEEFGGKTDLKNTVQIKENSLLIGRYFDRHFQLIINGKPTKAEFLGFTIEGEAAWCFLEAGSPGSIQKVEIHNRLLYASFKEQIHIFHLTIGEKRKSLKINNPESKAAFDF